MTSLEIQKMSIQFTLDESKEVDIASHSSATQLFTSANENFEYGDRVTLTIEKVDKNTDVDS